MSAARRYYQQDANNLALFFGSEKRLQLLKYLIPQISTLQHELQRSLNILDVGAGTGMHAAYIAKMNHKITAVDPVAEMLQQGIDQYTSPNLNFVVDSLPGLEKIDNTRFDVIYSIAAWQYIKPEDRQAAMERVINLLQPGGVFVIVWPNPISREFQFPLSPEEMQNSINVANAKLPEAQRIQTRYCEPIPDPNERMAFNDPTQKVFFHTTIGQSPALELRYDLSQDFNTRRYGTLS